MPTPTESETLLAVLQDPANHIVARLAKNPIDPDADALQLTDFEECDFVGYAPISDFDWQSVAQDDDNYGEAESKVLEWTAGTLTSPQQITAVYLTVQQGTDPVKLLAPFPLPVPIVVAVEGTVYSKRIRYRSRAQEA